MRIAMSTIRNVTRSTGEKVWPTAAEIAAGRERQLLLNIIVGQGCGDCCGHTPLGGEDGTEFICPLQRSEEFNARLSDDQRAAVETCGVPKLYADVSSGERTAVTVEDVHEACPFISYDGE